MASPAELLALAERERYALGLLAEEMGEALQIVGKWLRFGEGRGPDGPPYHGHNARELLPVELGDVLAAIDFAVEAGLADAATVTKRAGQKLAKLRDPNSRDAEGKRLAPDLRALASRGEG